MRIAQQHYHTIDPIETNFKSSNFPLSSSKFTNT